MDARAFSAIHDVLPIAASLRALLEAEQAQRENPWANVALTSKGKPWGESGLNRAFKRARDRAELDTWSYDDLRHYFVSELFRSGVAKARAFRGLRTGWFAFGSKQGHSPAMAPLAKKLDPVTLSLLNAPVDDEPLTEEDIRDIEASEEDIRCGRVISLEQLAQNLGIDLDKQT